ncbi:FxLYD domain-containing protein [Paenibacillus sp. JDR-2]|uniref:FxLYD domain-containing protein n=1 Tax=Paenibacillus sp. (strain JDR-2) TaxID=324057 RepID=UPI0005A253E7|nr:FxLYD domain-containing protein [Paenibacillus sp. JDR-2]
MKLYCHHCVREHDADAVYCSRCGRLLEPERNLQHGTDDQAAAFEEWDIAKDQASSALETSQPPLKQTGRGSLFIGLIPVIVLFGIAAVLLSYYLYEARLNNRVLDWQNAARQEALAGKYEEAFRQLNKAADARPDFKPVQADLKVVEEALSLDRTLTEIQQRLDDQDLGEASIQLEQVKSKLRGREEPIFGRVRDLVDEMSTKVTVLQVSAEYESMTGIDDLAGEYNQVKGLSGDEALALRQKIEAKIADISYDEADAMRKKKNFSAAITAAQKGLIYAPDNDKLTKLYDRIVVEKKNFEDAEQQRIEQAMQKAAEEDLINQTAAVKVKHIDAQLDLFGDFNVKGELLNAATRPIYSVVIEYTVHDSEGKVITTGKVDATPSYIEAGETFSFSFVVHHVQDENATVAIDHMTWYLD